MANWEFDWDDFPAFVLIMFVYCAGVIVVGVTIWQYLIKPLFQEVIK